MFHHIKNLVLLSTTAFTSLSLPASADPGFQSIWVRKPSPNAPYAALYMKAVNPGTEDVQITKVFFEGLEGQIHKTVLEKGSQMKMVSMDTLIIEKGKTIQLEPMGLHVMLPRPSTGWPQKKNFSFEIQWTSGKTSGLSKVEAAVLPPEADGPGAEKVSSSPTTSHPKGH